MLGFTRRDGESAGPKCRRERALERAWLGIRHSEWNERRCALEVVMGDIRQSLLPRDVLSAAKELLYHLDIYICNLLQSGRQPPQVDTKTLELVEEFILHAPKDRNTSARRMSALQELQLLEIMCSCFQEQSRDAVRQLMFNALFGLQGNQADESRMALLGKLVSMAIAVGRVPILECAATWLQRSHRVFCVRLAQVLVDDYCSMVPGSVSTLQNIHSASPRFCCQFITAVTTLYDLSSEELTPPTELLQMIVFWIQEDLRLILIAFLNTPLTGSQPISSLDVTPLGGLVRWCVKAPLAYRRDKKRTLPSGTGETGPDVGPLFSALHLSVLQVFMLLPNILNEKGLFGRLALLQMDSLATLASELSRLLDQADKQTHVSAADTQALSQLALDRLAQALQVAMANGALLCSREDLRAICSRLPHNNLLQLVLSGPVMYYNNIHTPPLAFSPHAAHSPIASHPAHTPLATHPSAHPQYASQPFMTGMAFPFRPSH
ncbi:integrator complex subunit 15 isoform X1 [Takifugu rubripes]|uniref:integrator complex subunit 15 isoform X1 n=1 Tax=Takifugu rubripes TaxID=31033 RepID=UPI001145BCCB|nr:uncharacterized protein C7orf26 homolog isoform X1 [Takifugu rubripes]